MAGDGPDTENKSTPADGARSREAASADCAWNWLAPASLLRAGATGDGAAGAGRLRLCEGPRGTRGPTATGGGALRFAIAALVAPQHSLIWPRQQDGPSNNGLVRQRRPITAPLHPYDFFCVHLHLQLVCVSGACSLVAP
jgi:hypothetical protein